MAEYLSPDHVDHHHGDRVAATGAGVAFDATAPPES